MNKLRSKFQKIQMATAQFPNARNIEWCVIDTDNRFKYMGLVYTIDTSVEQYVVKNKPVLTNSKWNEWTNDATMDRILCIDVGDSIIFYDENIDEIKSNFISNAI